MTQVQPPNNIPDCLPVQGQDVFNYLAGDASNHQLHMILTFENHLCQDILTKAIRLTMDIEPVLGCYFVEQPESAHWKRRNDLDFLNLCPISKTEYPDRELRKFISLSTDSRKDPLVQAQIFRTKNRDILCIKLDHACSDGGGLKEYTYMLAKVYNHLFSHQSYPVSQIHLQRNCTKILKEIGIDDPHKACNPSKIPPQPTWSFPSNNHQNQHPTFSMCHLNKQQFLSLKNYVKNHSATINDLLLTAYYRALFKINCTPEDQPQPISVSFDLRRYLSEDNKMIIANIGSSFNPLLSNIKGELFSTTLKRVSQITAELKQSNAIIPTTVFFEILGSMDFSKAKEWYNNVSLQTDKTNTFLSNFGVINPITFGEHSVIEGYIVSPAMFAPLFMLGASTYNHVLTLVINYYSSDIEQKLVQAFLNSLLKELESLTCP